MDAFEGAQTLVIPLGKLGIAHRLGRCGKHEEDSQFFGQFRMLGAMILQPAIEIWVDIVEDATETSRPCLDGRIGDGRIGVADAHRGCP